ncbi:HNH endonuclease family protein [Gordonia tangerina]|uniref:HNH endonuclease family protein n=1 Tax=Gordonia tangerina TaxID=2911060 RepID=A0ABS9DFP2_9ACTN|nr:HNH endonuclease family protein [Gordonia tangerina]MCF3937922.1 HNH endonuclease family protein [Gordonia tangerina]
MVSGAAWPLRWWLILVGSVLTAVIVAGGLTLSGRGASTDSAAGSAAGAASLRLAGLSVTDRRAERSDYQRAAFGAAWTDAVTVTGGGNGCDTRNDVLARDLVDVRRAVVDSCPDAVVAGEFRSPYTGEFIAFRRDRRPGAVQIDHIVPLAYAWDMGAWAWPQTARMNLANDPANLVAADAASNLTKSDQAPAEWMPPNRRFHCQYVTQFVMVMAAYQLPVDRRSRDVMAQVLRSCGA